MWNQLKVFDYLVLLLFVTGIKSVSVCRGRVQGVHSPTDGAWSSFYSCFLYESGLSPWTGVQLKAFIHSPGQVGHDLHPVVVCYRSPACHCG